MKRKYVKKLISTRELADFFSMHNVDVYRCLRMGLRLDYVYIVFNRDDLTIKEKREWLYKTSMSKRKKDNIFERCMGDYGFLYNRSKSKSLEFRI